MFWDCDSENERSLKVCMSFLEKLTSFCKSDSEPVAQLVEC